MKQHVFQPGENIEQIARQYGFRLPATIWDDASNESLRQLRKSAYALAGGDVLNIPDLQVKQEDASDEKRHVFQLRGLIRPAFYSRLVPDPDLPASRFAPVFSQPGAVGFDVSFAPHLSGALGHAAAAHESARFHALIAGRGRLADAALGQSVALLFLGNKDAWVSDALARHEEADLRTLLTWVANVLGFPCDPGRPGVDLAQGVGQALRRLRGACNIRERSLLFKADLEPRPAEDWPALFDAIEQRLRAAASLSKEQIAAARAKIQLLSPVWVDLTQSDGIEGTNPGASLDLVLFDEQVVKATPGSVHPLLSKLSAFMYTSLESKQTATTFEPLRPDLLEFEDVHFGPGRSVMLPTELTAAGPDEHWGITGADVLVAALRHAKEHPDRTILVTGHTDSTSTKSANFKLSKKRAESVRLMLIGMGVIDAWTELAAKDGTPEDAWEYLRWISQRFGYGCMPSPADAPNAAKDAKALLAFRRRYNDDVKDFAPAGNPYQPAFTKQLNLRGPLSRDDWRAFFEMMQRHFTKQLRIDMGQLIERQLELNFGDEGLGCGESHPFNEEERERRRLAMYEDENLGERPADRRVEIVFLDRDEAVLLGRPLLCHPTPGACKPELCMLYDQKLFEFRRLSAEPQRGKIEIIERTVMRDPRLFTDEQAQLVEEVSGDFTPILGEKVRILVRVTPPYVPFEGSLRLFIGRRTNSEEKPMSTVAQIDWKDPDPKTKLFELNGPRYFTIEWNGKGNKDVPREYSDRDVCDENQNKMVFIPMMEMKYSKKPARVRHGAYFIEWVQLLEKDESAAVDYAPSEEEQNELAMVVQPTIVLLFGSDSWRALNAVGFGATHEAASVPLVESYVEATAWKVAHFLAEINLRVVATRHSSSDTSALRVALDWEQHSPGSEAVFSPYRGATYNNYTLDGSEFLQNLFSWYDEFDSAQPSNKKDKASGEYAKRTYDIHIFTKSLVECTESDVGHAACLSAFGTTGFPSERRIVETWEPIGEYDKRLFKTLHGGPNEPRIVSEGGSIRGQVTPQDLLLVTAAVDSRGLVTAEATLDDVRVRERAEAIARALNAASSYVATTIAHEIGHLLGCAVHPEDKNGQPLPGLPMPDGTTALPYMNQDTGGHDRTVTLTGLMVDGGEWPVAQVLGLSGPARSFREVQRAYLKQILPPSSSFASRESQ